MTRRLHTTHLGLPTASDLARREQLMIKAATEIAFHREPLGLGLTTSHRLNDLWNWCFRRGEDGAPVLVLHPGQHMTSFQFVIPHLGAARDLAAIAGPYDAAVKSAWGALCHSDDHVGGQHVHRRGQRKHWFDPIRPDGDLPEILRSKT